MYQAADELFRFIGDEIFVRESFGTQISSWLLIDTVPRTGRRQRVNEVYRSFLLQWPPETNAREKHGAPTAVTSTDDLLCRSPLIFSRFLVFRALSKRSADTSRFHAQLQRHSNWRAYACGAKKMKKVGLIARLNSLVKWNTILSPAMCR